MCQFYDYPGENVQVTFDKDAEDAESTYIGCPTDRLDDKDE